jgi:hypothetical protein
MGVGAEHTFSEASMRLVSMAVTLGMCIAIAQAQVSMHCSEYLPPSPFKLHTFSNTL